MKTEKELKAAIEALKNEIDSAGQALKEEEEESEQNYEDWENDESVDKGDSPDVLDHSEAVQRLENAMVYLDQASEALNDD